MDAVRHKLYNSRSFPFILNKGTLEYGIDATIAIKKELEQIVEYEVFVPVDKDYKDVDYMRTHDLILEKMDGTIKARFVAGKAVKAAMNIDWGIDLYSPTIDSEIIFLILSIAVQLQHQLFGMNRYQSQLLPYVGILNMIL